MELISKLVAVVMSVVLVMIATALVHMIAVPIVNLVITFSMEPLSIPIVSQIILFGQLCALAVVIVVRVVKGINEGMWRGGRDVGGPTFSEWFLKSVLAVAGVALMPVFCSGIISWGSMVFNEIASGIGGAGALQLTTDRTALNTALNNLFSSLTLDAEFDSLLSLIASSVVVLVIMLIAIIIAYNLFKREVIILIVSIAAPWVSIKGSMDSADDYLDLLVSLLGLELIQIVQYVLFCVGVVMLNTMCGTSEIYTSVGFFDNDTNIRLTLMILAMFGGSLAVPSVLERYAFSSGRGGVGNMLVGVGVRGGASAVAKGVKSLGSGAATAAKALF